MKLQSAKCPWCAGNCLLWVRCLGWYCCDALDCGGSSWCSVWCGLFSKPVAKALTSSGGLLYFHCKQVYARTLLKHKLYMVRNMLYSLRKWDFESKGVLKSEIPVLQDWTCDSDFAIIASVVLCMCGQWAFGMPLNKLRGYTQQEVRFAEIFMTYWTNFAKTG